MTRCASLGLSHVGDVTADSEIPPLSKLNGPVESNIGSGEVIELPPNPNLKKAA